MLYRTPTQARTHTHTHDWLTGFPDLSRSLISTRAKGWHEAARGPRAPSAGRGVKGSLVANNLRSNRDLLKTPPSANCGAISHCSLATTYTSHATPPSCHHRWSEPCLTPEYNDILKREYAKTWHTVLFWSTQHNGARTCGLWGRAECSLAIQLRQTN